MRNKPIFLAEPSGFRHKICWQAVDLFDARKPRYSNFDFVYSHFQAKNTILRIFSLARKLGFQSFLVEEPKEEIKKTEDCCSLLNEENRLLRECQDGFDRSEICRISFFSSSIDSRPHQDNFLGYAVIKTDYYKDEPPNVYIYESVLPPYRTEKENDYLIHDDNFGPYFCVPKSYLENDKFSFLLGLSPKPENNLYAEATEQTAFNYLKGIIEKLKGTNDHCHNYSWYKRLEKAVTSKDKVNDIVLRSIFVNKEHYIESLKDCLLEKYLVDQFQNLPDKFWLVEVSCHELFSATRAKVGEVLLTINKKEEKEGNIGKAYYSIPIACRLPGIVYFENDDDKHPQETTRVTGYVPLFLQ